MRIIGGVWKRSKLPVADIPGLRPTPDRVRETLFNWLGQDLTGWRCVDAYAGSGALGFEAASRGAADVVLLERERRLLLQLGEVKQRLHAEAVQVQGGDAVAWMRRAPAASRELVFLDPPFETLSGASDVLGIAMAAAAALLVPGGYVYVEAPAPLGEPAVAACGCMLHRQARAGNVHFHLLQRRDAGDTVVDRGAA